MPRPTKAPRAAKARAARESVKQPPSSSRSPAVPTQEELEAYEKYQRQVEDALDARTTELLMMRKEAARLQASQGPSGPNQTTLDTQPSTPGALPATNVAPDPLAAPPLPKSEEQSKLQ